MTKNGEAYVIKDESLGGIEREYVEVNRKTEVGDKIVVVDACLGLGDYFKGDILTVTHVETDGVTAYSDDGVFGYFLAHSRYRVLEPTNVVHYEGKRYRLAEEGIEANVGDYVLVTIMEGNTANKIAVIVEDIDNNFFRLSERILGENWISKKYVSSKSSSDKYRVLVPLDDPPETTDDIIANLVRRVHELENGQKALYKLFDRLDERTQSRYDIDRIATKIAEVLRNEIR